MMLFEATKNDSMVLNLKDNSEKDTIINTINASGKFIIYDEEGIITLHLKSGACQKKYTRISKIVSQKICKKLKVGLIKRKKKADLLERVAKSQDITLSTSESLDAVCAGVII